MKINKHGKKYEESKQEEFKCDNCGCEFAVEPGECYIDYGAGVIYGSKDWIEISTNYTVSTTVKDVYVCSCPECHKIVKKEKEHTNSDITVIGSCSKTILDSCTTTCKTSKVDIGGPTNCDNTYSLTK